MCTEVYLLLYYDITLQCILILLKEYHSVDFIQEKFVCAYIIMLLNKMLFAFNKTEAGHFNKQV